MLVFCRPRVSKIPGKVFAFIALTFVVAMSGCDKPQSKKKPPVPVEIAPARTADVPIVIGAVGVVEPLQKVSIKAQVGGYVQEVGFTEGDAVTADQMLFKLDARTFEAARMQAAAQVRQAEVQLENARREAARAEPLFAKQMISAEERDARNAAVAAAEASVAAAKAALRTNSLNVEYATITSPVSGRTGMLQVRRGDLVRANDMNLVTINQMAPISVRFAVPEKELAAIRSAMAAGTVAVTAVPADGRGPVTGRLSFVDNAVDTKTGTIALKAEFANEDERLWPGQFVRAEAVVGTETDATVVPSRAVQTGQNGAYVFVALDGAASLRPITAGRIFNDETVVSGLNPGESVVVDGQVRLADKSAIELKKARSESKSGNDGPAENSTNTGSTAENTAGSGSTAKTTAPAPAATDNGDSAAGTSPTESRNPTETDRPANQK